MRTCCILILTLGNMLCFNKLLYFKDTVRAYTSAIGLTVYDASTKEKLVDVVTIFK
jgi:hypothetical protein